MAGKFRTGRERRRKAEIRGIYMVIPGADPESSKLPVPVKAACLKGTRLRHMGDQSCDYDAASEGDKGD